MSREAQEDNFVENGTKLFISVQLLCANALQTDWRQRAARAHPGCEDSHCKDTRRSQDGQRQERAPHNDLHKKRAASAEKGGSRSPGLSTTLDVSINEFKPPHRKHFRGANDDVEVSSRGREVSETMQLTTPPFEGQNSTLPTPRMRTLQRRAAIQVQRVTRGHSVRQQFRHLTWALLHAHAAVQPARFAIFLHTLAYRHCPPLPCPRHACASANVCTMGRPRF